MGLSPGTGGNEPCSVVSWAFKFLFQNIRRMVAKSSVRRVLPSLEASGRTLSLLMAHAVSVRMCGAAVTAHSVGGLILGLIIQEPLDRYGL